MFAGFVTKKTPASDLPVITENGPGPLGDDPGPGSALAPLEPGTLQVLEENEDITFSNPSEVGGSYEAFVWRERSVVEKYGQTTDLAMLIREGRFPAALFHTCGS